MPDPEDDLEFESAAPDPPSDWRLEAAERWSVPAIWKLALVWLLAAGMLLAGLVFGSGPRSFVHDFASHDSLFLAVMIGACLLGVALVSLIIAGVIAGVMKYLFLPFFGALARMFSWVAPLLGLAVLSVGFLNREQGIPWLNALATSTDPDHAAVVQWTPDSSQPEHIVSFTPQVTLPPTDRDIDKFKDLFRLFLNEMAAARAACDRIIEEANVKKLMVPSRISKDDESRESATMIAAGRRASRGLRDAINGLFEGMPARIKALDLSSTFLPKALEICDANKDALLPVFTEKFDLEDRFFDQAEREIRFLGERRLVWEVKDGEALSFQFEEDSRAFAEMQDEINRLQILLRAIPGKLRDGLLEWSKKYPAPR